MRYALRSRRKEAALIDPVTVFKDGGFYMYPILVAAMMAVPMSFLLALPYAFKKRLPGLFYVMIPMSVAALGVFGTMHGNSMALRAVGMASAETKYVLAANGHSVSLYTDLAGLYVAGLASIATAFFLGLAVAIGAGKTAKFTPTAVAPVAIGTLASIGAVVWSLVGMEPAFLSAGGLFVACLALGIATCRASEDPIDQARNAEGTLIVATLGLLGSACLMGAAVNAGDAMIWSAAAKASAEMKSTLMSMGMSQVAMSTQVGVICLVAGLLAAVFPVVKGIGSLLDARGLASAGLMFVPLVGTGTLELLQTRASAQLVEFAQANELLKTMTPGPLPVAKDVNGEYTDRLHEGSGTCVLRREGAIWQARTVVSSVQGPCPQEWSNWKQEMTQNQAVAIAAPPQMKLKEIAGTSWDQGTVAMSLLALPEFEAKTHRGARLTWHPTLENTLAGPGHQFLVEGPTGDAWLLSDKGSVEWSPRVELRVPGAYYGPASVILVPGKDWTVQQGVSFCASTLDIDDRQARCGVISSTPDEVADLLGIDLPRPEAPQLPAPRHEK
jgi:hypothetical protein